MTTLTETDLKPMDPALRPLLIPEISCKLAMGAKASYQGDNELHVTFEKETVRIHREDFALAKRVADRIKTKLPARLTPGAVLTLMIGAQRAMSEEVFRPDSRRILFFASQSEASAFYRCAMPAITVGQGSKFVAHCTMGKPSRAALEYDAVVIQIDHTDATLTFVKKLREMGKKVIYELDDAFDCLEPWHPQYSVYSQPENQNALFRMMAEVDAVQVSTPWLRERYRDYAKRIEVVPNMLELAAWPPAPRLRKDGLFKVLWAGSESHSGDLRLVMPALAAFAKARPEVRIVMFGQKIEDNSIPEGQLELIPFCDFSEYPFKLAEVDADVAIAPLDDVPFNHGKSNLRILQMWATGYPVIASRVGPYAETVESGVNGLLATSPDGWFANLKLLQEDASLRQKLSAGGLEAVKAYDLRPCREKIESFYSSVLEG